MISQIISDRKAFIQRLMELPSSSPKKQIVHDITELLQLSDNDFIDCMVSSWFIHEYGCSPITGKILIPKYLLDKFIYKKGFFQSISDALKMTVSKS